MSSSPHPQLSIDMNSSSMNVSTTFSSSIQVPSIANNYSASHNSQYSTNSVNSANNSPLCSYTKNSKLDLKIDLNSSSSSSNLDEQQQNKGENVAVVIVKEEILKASVTPMTPDAKQNFAFHPDQEENNSDANDTDQDVTDKNYKVTVQGQTPTPKMKRQTPSVHVKDNEDFPSTDPVMGSIDEDEEHESKEHESEQEETSESEDEEEEEEVTRSEEEIETELLGRFGYLKHKTITKTLQGNIFVAKLDSSSSSQKDGKRKSNKQKQVVIKKTSKQLHSEHVTVQNGKKFGIYENILKE